MTVAEWLEAAKSDALKRSLPDLVPALEGLARAMEALRAADWNDNAAGPTPADDDAGSRESARRRSPARSRRASARSRRGGLRSRRRRVGSRT
jgi:hypothetical protein